MTFDEHTDNGYQTGFVALVGRPNVGKSTLINQIIGEKVAITSPIAQTTRNRLRAIFTTNHAQMILVDTPGIHKPHHLLGERLVKSARAAIGEVDILLLLFEANHPPGRGDEFIIKLLKQQKRPVLVALNKSDLINKADYLKIEKAYRRLFEEFSWPVFTCSGLKGDGCEDLKNALIKELPIGRQLYPQDMISDQPEKVIISELIREQVLMNTREEVPHSVAVSIDRLEERSSGKSKKGSNGYTAILATICVERKSQKGILIGKEGSMLKKIGQEARLQIQKMIDGAVYLELFVKVVSDWRSKPSRLTELGYEVK